MTRGDFMVIKWEKSQVGPTTGLLCGSARIAPGRLADLGSDDLTKENDWLNVGE